MTCEKVETQIMKHSKLTLQYEWYKDALKCIREKFLLLMYILVHVYVWELSILVWMIVGVCEWSLYCYMEYRCIHTYVAFSSLYMEVFLNKKNRL